MRIIPKMALSVAAASMLVASCSTSDSVTTPQGDMPSIVVTYSVIGSIVQQLVGDLASVEVIIPDGQDPHEFQPSAKDVEALNNADIVVANGLDFEEGLEETLETAKSSGVNIFMIGEHVTVRELSDDGHSDDHGANDPHLWLSPNAMLEMLPELSAAIGSAIQADLSAQLASLENDLSALDNEIVKMISGINCKLVSGHDELGYFADRYGCEVIGAIIPSLSTTSEASAGELADLKNEVKTQGVSAIFTGLGTSPAVAEQLASELGVKAVTLSTHFLDGSANYREFMLKLAQQIVDALR
jgi:zinc/manganese transport system substrate-binding protein